MAGEKHEILFSRFGVNYNVLPARFRKGSVMVREEVRLLSRAFAPLRPSCSAGGLSDPGRGARGRACGHGVRSRPCRRIVVKHEAYR